MSPVKKLAKIPLDLSGARAKDEKGRRKKGGKRDLEEQQRLAEEAKAKSELELVNKPPPVRLDNKRSW